MKRAPGIVLNVRAYLSRLRILLRRLQEKKRKPMHLVRRETIGESSNRVKGNRKDRAVEPRRETIFVARFARLRKYR